MRLLSLVINELAPLFTFHHFGILQSHWISFSRYALARKDNMAANRAEYYLRRFDWLKWCGDWQPKPSSLLLIPWVFCGAVTRRSLQSPGALWRSRWTSWVPAQPALVRVVWSCGLVQQALVRVVWSCGLVQPALVRVVWSCGLVQPALVKVVWSCGLVQPALVRVVWSCGLVQPALVRVVWSCGLVQPALVRVVWSCGLVQPALVRELWEVERRMVSVLQPVDFALQWRRHAHGALTTGRKRTRASRWLALDNGAPRDYHITSSALTFSPALSHRQPSPFLRHYHIVSPHLFSGIITSSALTFSLSLSHRQPSPFLRHYHIVSPHLFSVIITSASCTSRFHD